MFISRPAATRPWPKNPVLVPLFPGLGFDSFRQHHVAQERRQSQRY